MASFLKNISISKKHRFTFVIIILIGVLGAALLFRAADNLEQNDHADHDHSQQEASAASGKPGSQQQAPDQTNPSGAAAPAASDNHQHTDGEAHADEADENLIRLTEDQIKAAGITLESAAPVVLGSSLTLSGEIQLNQDRTVHIVPRLSGTVESVHVSLGQQVRKGQLLAVLASSAATDSRSELKAAQQRLTLAKTTYDRELQLWQQKVSAEQDYLQARQTWQEAQLAVNNNRQKLAALGISEHASAALNRYELRAPMAGTIIEKHLTLGESIKEDSATFTISDLSQVWAELSVPAGNLASLSNGSDVIINTSVNKLEVHGRISLITRLINEQSRSAKARVVLPNPDNNLQPGLFITATIPDQSKQPVLSVLNQAIHRIDQRQLVFVRVSEGFMAQTVLTGRSDGQRTEILSGLENGAIYAANGSFIVKSELGKAGAEHSH